MADQPKYALATRTVRLKVDPRANGVKREAFAATVAEWQRAVDFYTQFFLDNRWIYAEHKTEIIRTGKHAGKTRERRLNAKELLSWAEARTVATPAHPDPERDFGRVCPGAPVEFRRAAINHASGAVRAHLTALAAWEAASAKRRRKKPSPPRPRPHLVAYAGLCAVRMEDYRRGFLRLKLFDGKRWCWHNVPVQGPPYAEEMFRESEREKARIAQQRARARARESGGGEEKGLQPAPGVWVAQSATVIPKGKDGIWIHVPFEKRVAIKGKAEERRQTEWNLRVGTVDLNADSTVQAAWEGRRLLSVKTRWHARENAKREKALQKVARKQRASGRPVKGERSNRDLWGYIGRLDDTLAWQIAAWIVAWAVRLRLEVLVFEYLRTYRPERGFSWSRRVNRKRSYWLRGKVVQYTEHLALLHGILVVRRNPAWTSRACPRCGHLGERFSPGGSGYPSRLRCGRCGWTGDANVVAALNLKRKWDRTFRYPTVEEKRAAEQRRARKGGAAANPEQVPVAV